MLRSLPHKVSINVDRKITFSFQFCKTFQLCVCVEEAAFDFTRQNPIFQSFGGIFSFSISISISLSSQKLEISFVVVVVVVEDYDALKEENREYLIKFNSIHEIARLREKRIGTGEFFGPQTV